MRALVLIALLAAPAHAVTRLCLDVRSDADEPGLRKLVSDELAHHPTHRLTDGDCESRLTVELFTVAGARYLTARVSQEVPVRYAIKSPRDLEEKLSDALALVLKNDPVYLAEDMSRMNAFLRAGTAVVKHGANRYRLELFEVFGSGVRNAVFASGAAFGVFRGSGHMQVFGRFEAAGSPRLNNDGVTLRALVGAEAGVLWEASARANSTFYIGPGVSLHYARFEGAAPVNGAPVEQPAINPWLFSVVLRAGFRFLRFYDVDVDLFAQVHLPLYPTKDVDSPLLVNGYTPYGSLGLGVGF
jgi:hypothetical protein